MFGAIVGLGTVLAIFCLAPLLLVLASFVGLAPTDFGILLIAVPVAGIGIVVAVAVRIAIGDLMLPRPVLAIGEDGILDRRVSAVPIPWSDVREATSLLGGGGGVVLELHSSTATDLNPWRAGTFLFERPEPGVAHIPVGAMTVPAAELAAAILERAKSHGAAARESVTHERMRRRRLM